MEAKWGGFLLLAAAALAIASAPVVASAKAATAATAETRYVEVRGDRIAYRRIGVGSPILVANRMRGTLDTWDPVLLDTLAVQHTVITVDYPGIGYSNGTLPGDIGEVATFLDDFATAVGLQRFAVMGWSWGGMAAQALVLARPERVTHGVLIGTNPPGPVPFAIQQASSSAPSGRSTTWLTKKCCSSNRVRPLASRPPKPPTSASTHAPGSSRKSHRRWNSSRFTSTLPGNSPRTRRVASPD
jgi:pimeloyl-ACP methyl ester carboxylesterase